MEKLGTALMMLPEVDALAIHENIPGARPIDQGYFTVPCNTSAVVALTYAGQPFTIDTRDLAIQLAYPNIPNGHCLSGIAARNFSDLGVPVWIVSVLPFFFFGFCESFFFLEKNKFFSLAIRS